MAKPGRKPKPEKIAEDGNALVEGPRRRQGDRLGRSGARRLHQGPGCVPQEGLGQGGRAAGDQPSPSATGLELAARARQLLASCRQKAGGGRRQGQGEGRGWTTPSCGPSSRRTAETSSGRPGDQPQGRPRPEGRAFRLSRGLDPRGRGPHRGGGRRRWRRAIELNPKNRIHAFHDPDFAELRKNRTTAPSSASPEPAASAGGRRWSRSAAAPAFPPCCAGSSTTSGTDRLRQLTGVVTVTDDGGSSGRLRRSSASCPRATSATASWPWPTTRTSWPASSSTASPNGGGLLGHSFGNLFLTALTGITGDFHQAILTAESILSVRGKIFPATLTDVRLRGRGVSGRVYEGESAVGCPARRIHGDRAGPRGAPGVPAGGSRPGEGRPDPPRSRLALHVDPPQPADPGHPPGPGQEPGRRSSCCST